MQVVADPTHTDSNGRSSLIDLALLSLPENLFSCSVIPPLENSTYNVHSGIHLKMRTRPVRAKGLSHRTAWRYTHANLRRQMGSLNILIWAPFWTQMTLIAAGKIGELSSYTLWMSVYPKPPFPIGVTYHGYPKILSTQFGNETTITEWLGKLAG